MIFNLNYLKNLRGPAQEIMNPSNFGNDQQLLGHNGSKMMHSTSLNTLNQMASGAVGQLEQNRAALPTTMYTR